MAPRVYGRGTRRSASSWTWSRRSHCSPDGSRNLPHGLNQSAGASSQAAATFLFADIAGFTALTEAHGDEQAAALVADFCAAVNADLQSFGGTHVKSIGDALMLRVPEPGNAVRL